MSQWKFRTTPKSEAALAQAVTEMVRLFSADREEAVARINHEYQGLDLVTEDFLYFDNPGSLARFVWHGDYWWLSKLPLRAKPYLEPSRLEGPLQWAFETDAESDGFLREIVSEMIRRFYVDREDAVARVNQQWKHYKTLLGTDMRFRLIAHELPEYWACDTYFGHESEWWLKPAPLDKQP